MKQNLNRRSKHLVHVTVGKENYEVKVVMGKYDFHCLVCYVDDNLEFSTLA